MDRHSTNRSVASSVHDHDANTRIPSHQLISHHSRYESNDTFTSYRPSFHPKGINYEAEMVARIGCNQIIDRWPEIEDKWSCVDSRLYHATKHDDDTVTSTHHLMRGYDDASNILRFAFIVISAIFIKLTAISSRTLNIIMMIMCLICINAASSSFNTPWIKGPTQMQHNKNDMALGYDEYNNKIWVVGGSPYDKQLMSFNTDTLDFTDHGSNNLSQSIRPFGGGYVQIDNILYMAHYLDNKVHKMSIQSGIIQYNYITVPTISNRVALAAFSNDHDYLIAAGGFIAGHGYTNYTEIYDMTDNLWLSNVPQMNVERGQAVAVVVDQRVYCFGSYGFPDSIEILDVSDMANIQNKAWSIMSDKLITGIQLGAAVVYGTDIITIGGGANALGDIVSIIDTITMTVSNGGSLNFALTYSSGIVAYPRIYEFGGYLWNDGNPGQTSDWQYYDLRALPELNNYDKPINIYPSLSEAVNKTINIRSNIQLSNNNISYYAKFNIMNDPFLRIPATKRLFYENDS